jgi:hypothetical protein
MTFLALQDAAGPAFFTMDRLAEPDILGGWLICFFTLAVFSFLYKDNPFYKTAEHTFVGAGTAFFALQYYKEGIREPIIEHIDQALERRASGDPMLLGGFDVDPTWAIVFRCLAVVFSLMLLVRLVKSDSWMPRWPLAIMVGVYAAIKLTGETQSKLVLQVSGAIRPLTDPTKMAWGDNWAKIEETQVFYTFANLVLLVGLTCALIYFIFTYKRGPVLGAVSRVGVIVLMITFGSMFGFTVLGRFALLIERVDHLDFYTRPGYTLVEGGGLLSVLLSPPGLVAIGITLVLLLAKLRGGNDDGGTRAT